MMEEQEEKMALLEDKAHLFKYLFTLKGKEVKTNKEDVTTAWELILRNYVSDILDLLNLLKDEITWSLLDDKRERFHQIKIELEPMLNTYEDCVGEEMRKMINDIILMLDEGFHGFRQSFISETYYEGLFRKVMKRYREENEERLELIYMQDSQDEALIYPDATQLKNTIVVERANILFGCRFGQVFHNNGRNIKLIVAYILEQKEQTYNDIYDFLDKYLSYQIAMEHSRMKVEAVFKNIAFKENVDVDKLMLKLKDLIEDKTLNAQKHWFIVYKVFFNKNWLKKSTQRLFIDQINSAFSTLLKCSTADFHEINSYFKQNDYNEWTLADCDAPQCCDIYREIADKLDDEFQDAKYAKPGKVINTKRVEKFR